MKRILKKIKILSERIAFLAFVYGGMVMTNFNIAYADKKEGSENLKSSKLVKGTENLFTDITEILMILAPTIGAVMIAFFFIQMQISEEEGDTKAIKKRIKVAAIATVGVFITATTINLITSYYK